FTYYYVQVLSPIILNSQTLSPYAGLYTNAAHNDILQTWAEQGILSLATLIFLVAVFFWQLIQELKQSGKVTLLIRLGLIALMLAFVLHAQMNFVLQLPTSRLLFFALLIVPGALLDKNRFGRGRLIPVEFSLRVLSVSVWLEQMKTPRLIEVKPYKSPIPLRIVLCVLVVVIGSWLMLTAVRPLVSDILYKDARVLLDLNDWTQAEHYFKKALNIWQDHSDCRSAYSTFLLEQGRYKEAIEQIHKVQERLQASETYYRLGLAYYKLHQFDHAAANWKIYFSRFPRAKYLYPNEYHWLINYLKNKHS
ncbi:tetratricopeptide repeat protein, partial [Candidatus Sumerlaeota bacterium]|nr:tetratricopeptide repeat protein [Candidatus Sumerlaeota bacterium]